MLLLLVFILASAPWWLKLWWCGTAPILMSEWRWERRRVSGITWRGVEEEEEEVSGRRRWGPRW